MNEKEKIELAENCRREMQKLYGLQKLALELRDGYESNSLTFEKNSEMYQILNLFENKAKKVCKIMDKILDNAVCGTCLLGDIQNNLLTEGCFYYELDELINLNFEGYLGIK